MTDKEINKALHLDPNRASTYYNEANALHDLNLKEETLAAYEQAIQLAPREATLYYQKGQVLEQLGRLAEARRAYDEAQDLGYEG